MQQAQHDLAACTKQQMVWDTSKPPIFEEHLQSKILKMGGCPNRNGGVLQKNECDGWEKYENHGSLEEHLQTNDGRCSTHPEKKRKQWR